MDRTAAVASAKRVASAYHEVVDVLLHVFLLRYMHSQVAGKLNPYPYTRVALAEL